MADSILFFEERKKLRSLVANLYSFVDLGPRGRREFIQNAGLGRFVPGMDLSGASETVAGDLIGRLEKYGALQERPAYHALGALLDATLDVGEISQEDQIFIARLIVRYALVSDQGYIEQIRQKYQITEDVTREPKDQYRPPRPVVAAATSAPSFTPHVADVNDLETIINSEDNFLDIYLLYGALYCSHAVCRIEEPANNAIGTGFLINKNILLTNQHVIEDKNHLENAVARFRYQADSKGVPGESLAIGFDPDFYYASDKEELDYAVLRLKDEPLASFSAQTDAVEKSIQELVLEGKHRGYLALAPELMLDKYRVNIIQHPAGNPMKVVLTQNYVVGNMSESRVQYVADTNHGSSGSPVFNQKWQVIALHHSGSPYPADSVQSKFQRVWKGRFRVNEGIPMRAILADFRAKQLDRFLPR